MEAGGAGRMERNGRQAGSVFIVGSFEAAPLKEGFKLLPEVGLPAMASGVVSRIEAGKTMLRVRFVRKSNCMVSG